MRTAFPCPSTDIVEYSMSSEALCKTAYMHRKKTTNVKSSAMYYCSNVYNRATVLSFDWIDIGIELICWNWYTNDYEIISILDNAAHSRTQRYAADTDDFGSIPTMKLKYVFVRFYLLNTWTFKKKRYMFSPLNSLFIHYWNVSEKNIVFYEKNATDYGYNSLNYFMWSIISKNEEWNGSLMRSQ